MLLSQLFLLQVYPGCDASACALLEGEAEGAVAVVTALAGQLLDGEGLAAGDGLLVASGEMVDAQVVDIDVVVHVLTGEILAEIQSVDTNGLGELVNGEVPLQVELLINAM